MRNLGKGATVDQPTRHQRGYSSATNGRYAINSSKEEEMEARKGGVRLCPTLPAELWLEIFLKLRRTRDWASVCCVCQG